MTATQKEMVYHSLEPIVLTYNEINQGRYRTTRHFVLVDGQTAYTPLTEKLNVSENRKFAKSNPDYWVKVRRGNKWASPSLTGLFPTNENQLFYGDANKRQSLILFEFVSDEALKVYFYRNYYPADVRYCSSLIK